MNDSFKTFLPNVLGLWEIKKELEAIYGWYKDPSSAGARRSMLPKGVLFYGEPGFGKTLLTREYSKIFDCPVYVIEGSSENAEKEILDVYDDAAKNDMAIVIIDEIDRLIDNDKKLTRILQTQLDGFKENYGVLTLATANHFHNIPEALLREGRFDRVFHVQGGSAKETEEVINVFLNNAGISVREEEMQDLVAEFSAGMAPCHIRAAINGAALRKGNSCTVQDILDSSYFVQHGAMPNKAEIIVTKRSAVHEAGHAAFLYFFCETITYGRIYFSHTEGITTLQIKQKEGSFQMVNERIRAALAGLVAEELVFKTHDMGSGSDLSAIHNKAKRIVGCEGIDGPDRYVPLLEWKRESEMSDASRREFEVATRRYIKRQYKVTKRLMRRLKPNILRLADFLLENKKATKQEIASILGGKRVN